MICGRNIGISVGLLLYTVGYKVNEKRKVDQGPYF